jgi:3-isopropylmalate/(R)-2-methylmalate dehydratase small subunit
MKKFSGNVLFLDRSDINTDEIIPARYLTENDKSALKPYLLDDLELDGFSPETDIAGKRVIITRGNFGCGSSREHAPWALEANGIHLVIGESFARIFRQNMFNCGMMAIELPSETIDYLVSKFTRADTHLETDFEKNKFIITANGVREEILFLISDFDRDLVISGGWVDYADGKY